jgi:hypothetical protein
MNTHPTTRRSWSHKSVRALIRSEGGGDPIEIIRAKSRSVVRWAKNLGWQGPPYDPLKLASLRGIRSKQSDGLFSAEAQLTPMDGEQLLLEFNPNRAPCRKNFSISHELVHTFFDDCFEMVHHRKSNPKAFDPQHEVEQLCQAGAAEILIPQDDFLLDLERLSRSLSIVPELCERYQASREAVARRILTFSRFSLPSAQAGRKATRFGRRSFLGPQTSDPLLGSNSRFSRLPTCSQIRPG